MAKQGRTTVYNNIVTEEKMKQVNPDNITLMEDFLDYLSSVDRSKTTINAYHNDLKIFWCWNLDFNKNKFFVEMNKREFAKFQNYGLTILGWSSNRVRRVKSTLSSLSNFIEDICDDEYEGFRSIVKKIENPVKEPVREKTVLTEEQIQYLLDTLIEKERYQQACAVALAIYSGCRKAELTRFKVSYFNEENIIHNSMYATPEKIRCKGRGGKVGKLLKKYTLLDFKPYFELWMKKRQELGIDNEWLFVSFNSENGKYEQAKVTTMDSFAETCSKILDTPFYFHCLRHALCTKLCKNNYPPKIIQEYFGWASQDLISVYDDSEAVDDFGKYFSDGIIKQEEKTFSDL